MTENAKRRFTVMEPPLGSNLLEKEFFSNKKGTPEKRRHTMVTMSKFINKAAAEKKLKSSSSVHGEDSVHNSSYWSSLDKSHVSDYLDSVKKNTDAGGNRQDSHNHSSYDNKNADKFHFEIEDNDQEKRIPPHMISPNSLFRLLWNVIIFILAISTALFLPIRMAFMDETDIAKGYLYFDLFTDFIFIVDIGLQFFFVEEDVNGEIIVDIKKLAVSYLKSWFAIDMIASIPVSLILFLSKKSDIDHSIASIRFLKLTKFTRLYRLLSLFKMIKLLKNHKHLEVAVSYLHVSSDIKQIISSLIRLVFLLHIVGCTYAIVALMTAQDHMTSWINSQGIDDESVTTRYIAACYWAVVTISTVGYGDITPTNEAEVLATIILVFIGVSMYSYIISRLTSIFATVKNQKSEE